MYYYLLLLEEHARPWRAVARFLRGVHVPKVFFLFRVNYHLSWWAKYRNGAFLMSGKSKKNKRGDRGSTDEELIESKRANMAATVEEGEGAPPKEPTEISEEPSRRKLREMLVDIQITVNNILLENKKISNDALELKATMQKQQLELATLKEVLAKATKERASTEKELAAATKKLDAN